LPEELVVFCPVEQKRNEERGTRNEERGTRNEEGAPQDEEEELYLLSVRSLAAFLCLAKRRPKERASPDD